MKTKENLGYGMTNYYNILAYPQTKQEDFIPTYPQPN